MVIHAVMRRRLSRRSHLLGGLGTALAACRSADFGSPGPTPTVADEPSIPEPTMLPLHRLPGAEWGEPLPGFPPPPSPTVAAVELVWQADGGPDRLRLPTGLAVGRDGAVFVVDAGHDRLIQLSAAGQVAARWVGPGGGVGQFRFAPPADAHERAQGYAGPAGGAVAVDGEGQLLVADTFNVRVQRLDRAGRDVATWADAPLAVEPLVEPAGIAVDDRRGRVYVADAGAHRLHAFDLAGRRQFTWGGLDQGPGEFVRPAAVAVDRAGQVYVADWGNDRIQVFDDGGRFVTMWGGPGPRPDGFWGPIGVAVDAAGRVYVAAARRALEAAQRVLVFNNTGVFLAAWDGPGGEAGACGAVVGVAVDELGGVYVAAQAPDRVVKVRARGPWPTPATALPTALPATPTATPGPLGPPPTRVPLTPTDR